MAASTFSHDCVVVTSRKGGVGTSCVMKKHLEAILSIPARLACGSEPVYAIPASSSSP